MPPLAAPRPIPTPVRPAERRDAAEIGRLYAEAYRPAGGGDPRDHYPYPQLLDPGWLASAVGRPELCWVVAEAEGRVVGSAAAVRNVGGGADRVAEVFGIVVDPGWRRLGFASRMLLHLVEELGDVADFILCESRTADPGGWKVARSCAFSPIGFEPFAHTTPAGSEPMLLTARLSSNALAATTEGLPPLPPSAEALRAAVFSALPAVGVGDAERWRQPTRAGLRISRVSPRSGTPAGPLAFRIDHCAGSEARGWTAALDGRLHRGGVVSLRHLEGEDPRGRRYDRLEFACVSDDRVVGRARALWDRIDRRARIQALEADDARLSRPIIAGVAEGLERLAGDDPLALVAEVRADDQQLPEALEALGFFPTSYYPALIASGPGRADAIQYTRLSGRRPPRLDAARDTSEWPEAGAVVRAVLSGIGPAAAVPPGPEPPAVPHAVCRAAFSPPFSPCRPEDRRP